MKKHFALIVSFFFAFAAVICVLSPATPGFAADTYYIKFNYPGPKAPPSMHPLSQAIGMLGQKLEENSGGRFKVDIYWGASLYKDDATQYSALRSNVIQMCEVSGGRWEGKSRKHF